MSRDMNYNNGDWANISQISQSNRQRDLVLAVNEFAFIMAKTNGAIKTYTGPITMTISAQESLVVFNPKTKKFEETQDFEKAKQLFVSAPEGWYIVLKNPSADNAHPEPTKAVNSAPLNIGRKINIAGPASFSLFPGQMARVIRGHRLRSNQYLLARVYDAEAARKGISTATIVDAEGKEVNVKPEEYFVGQMLVIKGTEVSFYIPPTGIEVIPIENSDQYVRDAVTLERLEYAILKDEDGEKRYIHGPAVVFPKPTETFVSAPKGGLIFRALELSPISGIYVKVIAAYDEKKGGKTIHHPIGEELFITGNDQMIYYPRPEHAMIQYDGKYMHHAIAIPEGEGRYILNRLTGKITTVKGPKMYLPDPRTEVVVKRKLTPTECRLMYPENNQVMKYNQELTEQAVERMARKGLTGSALTDTLNMAYSTSNQESTLAIFEANANISRGVSYTKPRTITLDTKFDGAVAVDVWSGYAIDTVTKTGERKTVVGPATHLLNYDETLEAIHNDQGEDTGFLQIRNNKIYDCFKVYTSDHVGVELRLNYYVDFDEDYKDSWFSLSKWDDYLIDNMRALVKKKIKKYSIEDFFANSTDILRAVILNTNYGNDEVNENADKEDKPHFNGRFFKENGMVVNNTEILNVAIEKGILDFLTKRRDESIRNRIELTDAEDRIKIGESLSEVRKKKAKIDHDVTDYIAELEQNVKKTQAERELALSKLEKERELAEAQAKKDIQKILSEIQTAEVERAKEKAAADIAHSKELAEIDKMRKETYAATVKEIMESISPDLVAAIAANSQAEILKEGMASMAPYALAKDESVADTVNKLLRGTPLEEVLDKVSPTAAKK
jgi:major vault protein